MGNRITFRERTPGVAVSDGDTPPAVSRTEPRVKFVKGWFSNDGTDPSDSSLVKCGPGSDYPLECKLDQIAEIFYRCRDAKFTSGAFSCTYDTAWPVESGMDPNPPDPGSYSINVSSGDVPAKLVSNRHEVVDPGIEGYPRGLLEMRVERGMFINNLLQSEVGFGDVYQVKDYEWNDPDPYETQHPYQDAESEPGIWSGHLTREEYPTGLTITRTGLSHYFSLICFLPYQSEGPIPSNSEYGIDVQYSQTPTEQQTTGGPFNGIIGSAKVLFLDRVAFTGDSPDAPGSRLFVGMRFAAGATAQTGYGYSPGLTTLRGDYHTATELKLSIVLSNSTLELPLWINGTDPEQDPYISYIHKYQNHSGENWVLTATKWWPYATTSGNDAWDISTGRATNGGPGA